MQLASDESMQEYNAEFIANFFALNPYLPSNGREKTFASLGTLSPPMQLVKSWSIETSPGLLLHGPSGCGKSHALIALMNQIIDSITATHHLRREYVIWTNPVQMLEKLRDDEGKANWMRLLEASYYLFIDDLGCESLTEWGLEQMYHVLEVRKNKGLPTFVSTNLAPDEPRKKYHERFLSRLRESFLFVQLTGEDYRNVILKERTKAAIAALKKG